MLLYTIYVLSAFTCDVQLQSKQVAAIAMSSSSICHKLHVRSIIN